MKQIPPAIQEKEHYLKFRVRGEEKEIGEVVEAIWKSVTDYLGSRGTSKADIWIIGNKFDEISQVGVIRVRKGMIDELRAAITIDPGFEDDTFVSVEKVSETISGLEN